MAENDIIIAMQEAVRKAIATEANKEMEKQLHKFECKMGEIKSKCIGELVNSVQIAAMHSLPDGKYTVQIIINGRADNG